MDFEQLQQALGLASSAVGITGKAAETINSIKRLVEGGTKPDSEEAQRLLNSLASELTTANVMNVQLSAALKSLSQELHRQDEFEKEKARYELFRTEAGDMIFKLRESTESVQPDHFICPVCLNKDKLISYLHVSSYAAFCQTERKHSFAFRIKPKTNPPRNTGGSWLTY